MTSKQKIIGTILVTSSNPNDLKSADAEDKTYALNLVSTSFLNKKYVVIIVIREQEKTEIFHSAYKCLIVLMIFLFLP